MLNSYPNFVVNQNSYANEINFILHNYQKFKINVSFD